MPSAGLCLFSGTIQAICFFSALIKIKLGVLKCSSFFSNFILSRTDHVPVRDKIKIEKHGLSIAAWLVKVTSTAASEMYKSCTDIAGSAKSMAGGTVDDLQMAKPLSHRSPITMIFLV